MPPVTKARKCLTGKAWQTRCRLGARTEDASYYNILLTQAILSRPATRRTNISVPVGPPRPFATPPATMKITE